jgi:putative ABC transport system permease protein
VSGASYLAGRYLAFHRWKAALLVTALTLILFIPIGLRVLVRQSSEQLSSRAQATPLLFGAPGSPTELVLNSLYFSSDVPAVVSFAESGAVAETGLATPIPLYVRFRVRDQPIVGTTPEYFSFRDLRMAAGRPPAILGEAVLGAAAARSLGVGVGGQVVSSPESVFDIAGVYPLRMEVTGILEFADTPDDDAVFVDIKTAWVIEGLGHGHQDLSRPEAAPGVLKREGNVVIGNAAVVQYNEITSDNIDTFHFHGDPAAFPVTAIIAVPNDDKASALLQGRYQDSATLQIVRPETVMAELLGTVFTVERFVVAGAGIVGLATFATVLLVFLLSLRQRERERETLGRIGGSPGAIRFLMGSEIAFVLSMAVALAALLTWLASRYGSEAARVIVGI